MLTFPPHHVGLADSWMSSLPLKLSILNGPVAIVRVPGLPNFAPACAWKAFSKITPEDASCEGNEESGLLSSILTVSGAGAVTLATFLSAIELLNLGLRS